MVFRGDQISVTFTQLDRFSDFVLELLQPFVHFRTMELRCGPLVSLMEYLVCFLRYFLTLRFLRKFSSCFGQLHSRRQHFQVEIKLALIVHFHQLTQLFLRKESLEVVQQPLECLVLELYHLVYQGLKQHNVMCHKPFERRYFLQTFLDGEVLGKTRFHPFDFLGRSSLPYPRRTLPNPP